MITHTELEFKFAYDPVVALRLAADGYHPAHAQRRVALRTTYYDTPEGALVRSGVALRVRHSPEGYFQTVKTAGDAAFERLEYEQRLSGAKPQRAALAPPTSAGADLVHKEFGALRAAFTSTVHRSVWRVQATRSLVLELSLDEGEIRARMRSNAAPTTTAAGPARLRAPIAELEIERISGTRLEFLHWAVQFAQRHQLSLLQASKQEQGMRLCGPQFTSSAPRGRQASALQPTHTVAQACAAALQADTGQILSNIAALCQGHDPEALHQLHIALQRFRTTVRTFALVRHDGRWRSLVAQARAWAQLAGRARDAEVFAMQSWPAVRASFDSTRAMLGFTRLVERYRDQCYGHCCKAFCCPAVTAFALQAAYLTECIRQGRTARHKAPANPTPCSSKAQCRGKAQTRFSWNEPVRRFLQAQLHQLGRRLRARLRKAHNARAWHRARLAAKRLRYTLELALPALPGAKRHAQVLQLLALLQRDLGKLNDQAVARRTVRQVAALAPPGANQTTHCARALVQVDGWSKHSPANATAALATAQRIRQLLGRAGR